MQPTSTVSNLRLCPPHGPHLIDAVEDGLYAAWCLACGLMGPKRKDGLDAYLALGEKRGTLGSSPKRPTQ
jgi:hypothetical protein